MSEKNSNLAFKCTWNDAGFKGICSKKAYDHNISMNRVWCKKAPCRTFEGHPNETNHPCYECIIFIDWRYGAGWDHTNVERPRKILNAKVGKIALLTTLEPDKLETERKIIGFMKINNITEGQEKETVIYGDPEYSVEIDPSINIKFWEYYKNPNAPDRHVWGTGLFRYINDGTIMNFLCDLKEIYEDRQLSKNAISKIDENLRDYKDIPIPLKKRLKEIKADEKGILCPQCGHQNLVHAKFCNECGRPICIKCYKCLTINSSGSNFCLQCGAKLTGSIREYPKALRDKLLEFGRQELGKHRSWIFTPNLSAEKLICEDSNAFLFAVIFDQGIEAERAWALPYELKQRLGHLDPGKIANISFEKLRDIFGKVPKLHRFWKTMARRIKDACILLGDKYDSSAVNIWADKPDARELYNRLVKFNGIGQKKASMATNIIFRDLGFKITDKSGIDVSYDEMVRRVFLKTGLVKKDTLKDVVDAARSLNPEYPGELDYPAWLIGRNWCLPKNPKCHECYLNDVCPQIGN
jgi:endonuclease III